MKSGIGVLLLLTCVLSTEAQIRSKRPARLVSFVRTHGELLVSDALVALSESADAASSVACQHARPVACSETNPLLGKHPSAAATWGYAIGGAVAIATAQHLAWKFALRDDPPRRHVIWFGTGPLAISEARTAYSNLTLGEGGRAQVLARRRLLDR